MALIKCKECGKEVSSKATTCPHCGVAVAKQPKSYGCGALILVLIIGAFVLNAVMGWMGNSAGPATPIAAPAKSKPTLVPPVGAWQYLAGEDSMSGKQTLQASLNSLTTFNLGFPYQGIQTAELTVRKHPRYGIDSIVSIQRGQLQCGVSDGCKLQVRFDDAPPQSWTFVEPQSHDTTTLFIRDGEAFARKLAGAKVVKIELEFFQESPVVVEFLNSDLDLKKVGL